MDMSVGGGHGEFDLGLGLGLGASVAFSNNSEWLSDWAAMDGLSIYLGMGATEFSLDWSNGSWIAGAGLGIGVFVDTGIGVGE
jgi:hypothetical protein